MNALLLFHLAYIQYDTLRTCHTETVKKKTVKPLKYASFTVSNVKQDQLCLRQKTIRWPNLLGAAFGKFLR